MSNLPLLIDLLRQEIKIYEGTFVDVGNFLNHCVNVQLLREIGSEFTRLYKGCGVTKILTAASSGIAPASATALNLNVPFVYAKKSKPKHGEFITTKVYSRTYHCEVDLVIPRDAIRESDKILIIDDFLATGSSLNGLITIARSCGADIIGAGVVVEKKELNARDISTISSIRIEALSTIETVKEGKIYFSFHDEVHLLNSP